MHNFFYYIDSIFAIGIKDTVLSIMNFISSLTYVYCMKTKQIISLFVCK
jgi:hypothetical protein